VSANSDILEDIYSGLQRQMEAQLSFVRGAVRHPSAKGSASELEWARMLSSFLPRRYCVTKGFIVDSRGGVSDEIDLIIFDRQYSPFILELNGAQFLPAECVYGVLEVKQDITPTHLEYAKRKAASVRRLHRTSVEIPHAGGKYPKKVPPEIIAGILALDGTVSIAEQGKLSNDNDAEFLNLGCALRSNEVFHLSDFEPWIGNPVPRKYTFELDSRALAATLLYLIADLQRVGTVVAMDIMAYRRRGSI